ncbi:uncharacterized protein L203_103356 [Cryptococcus depauperatus CBS 7841]|uniref:Uncharacterized protein n=1 Tax=Cryptococcus depauperatus CBS 7841 TaxID=1295531 RepID=A0A1E3I1S2_9TREE|nr:hypothetical protein L203_05389 [Cryptococcus depauperatus CBS 7841]
MALTALVSQRIIKTHSPSSHPVSSNYIQTLNSPDSDIVPSILYDPNPSIPSRGRTHSRTYEWYEAYQKKREKRKSSGSSNSEASSGVRERDSRSDPLADVDAQTVSIHHRLPAVDAEISSDPILYLPPLLSPLPKRAEEDHRKGSEPDDALKSDIRIRVAEVDKRLGMKEEDEQMDPLKDFDTRLPHIDPASLALHQALHHFQPLTNAYPSTPYDQAFNWSGLSLPLSTKREWYCVVFRSRRKPQSTTLSLYKADREAHEEAVKNGGLIMYWYGVPDETGLNLATCIWQSRRHAIKAISGPKHMFAMKQTEGAYETYSLERWVLSKERGSRGVKLRPWQGGDVGW